MVVNTAAVVTALNAFYANSTGETTTLELSTNLENIVDFGKSITESTTFSNTYTNDLTNLIAKIGKTVFVDTKFKSTGINLFMDSAGYSGVLEVVSVDIGEYDESLIFSEIDDSSENNSFEKLFGVELPTVHSKYFNKKVAYSQKITIKEEEYRDSFKSADDFNSFWSRVLMRINEKREYAKDLLTRLAFSAAALTSAKNHGVKQLSLNASGITELNNIIADMSIYSKQYSNIITSTTADDMILTIYAPSYNAYKTALATVYNKDMLNIPFSNIEIVPNFQYTTSGDKNKISGVVPNSTTGKYTTINNVVAVLRHKQSVACYNSRSSVTSQFVANTEATNYFYNDRMEFTVNSDLPFIVFTENGSTDITETTIPTE